MALEEHYRTEKMGADALTRSSTAEDPPAAIASDLSVLIDVIPDDLRAALNELGAETLERELIEIVLDLGRSPEARLATRGFDFGGRLVNEADLIHVEAQIGTFAVDNRAGIERTLHRIAAMRNRKGKIIGLTLRVGRAVFGTIDSLRDLLESKKNILLLGRPGVGKTTKLREIARVLANDFNRRVIVVDTSNEIGGDGDVPHPAIGSARRMQVPRPELQHNVMIEGVENHMPEVIVIDEIGTELEASAARTIAERGVQLIGTAHGTTLENLVLNPTVSDLVGGTHTVTLSDEEARRRRTPKTITERRGPPTFDIVVEMVNRDEVVVYPDTAKAVDLILEGLVPEINRRKRSGKPDFASERRGDNADEPVRTPPSRSPRPAPNSLSPIERGKGDWKFRLCAYGLSQELVARAAREVHADVKMVEDPTKADIVIAKRRRRTERSLGNLTEQKGGPSLYYVKRETTAQIRDVLRRALAGSYGADPTELAAAMREAESAIERTVNERRPVSLAPRDSKVRRMQHQVISRYNLGSESVGSEPTRHLVVYPPDPGGDVQDGLC